MAFSDSPWRSIGKWPAQTSGKGRLTMKKTVLLAGTALALAFGISTAEAAKLKACWVYTGPIGDFAKRVVEAAK